MQCSSFFFFNDTATTEIYTLSLHDALPIYTAPLLKHCQRNAERENTDEAGMQQGEQVDFFAGRKTKKSTRSEEHTSELQSRLHLVCRLLLEKKKTKINRIHNKYYIQFPIQL